LDVLHGRVIKHLSVEFAIHYVSCIRNKLLVGGVMANDFHWATRFRQTMVDQESFAMGKVTSLPLIYTAFSTSGRFMVSLGYTGSGIYASEVIDFGTGKRIRLEKDFFILDSEIEDVQPVFSDDETMIAGVDAEHVMVFSLETGKLKLLLNLPLKYNGRITFSSDSKSIFVVGYDRKARQWDIATGKLMRVYAAHTERVTGVSVSKSWGLLATGSEDGSVHIWSIKGERDLVASAPSEQIADVRMVPASGHTDSIRDITLSTDGRLLLTGSSDRTAIIWNVQRGLPLRRLERDKEGITATAFSPGSRLILTGSNDGRVRLRRAVDGREIWQFKSGSSIDSAMFSGDGRMAMVVSGGFCWIWDVHRGEEVMRLGGNRSYLVAATFSPDGDRIASIDRDGVLRFWGRMSGRELFSKEGFGGAIGIRYAMGGQQLMVITKTAVQIIDSRGKILNRISGSFDRADDACFTPDGRRVVITGRSGLELRDAMTGAVRARVPHSEFADHPRVTSDGRKLLASVHEGIQTWSLENINASAMKFGKYRGTGLHALSFSPNGQDLLLCSDLTCRLWSMNTGQEYQRLVAYDTEHYLTKAGGRGQFVSDDRIATYEKDLTSSVVAIHFWDRRSGALKQTMRVSVKESPLDELHVAFSVDGGKVAVAYGTDVTVWQVAGQRELLRLSGIQYPVSSLAFSPDGHELVTTSEVDVLKGTPADYKKGLPVRLWNISTGKEKDFGDFRGGAAQVLFTRDGRRIIAIQSGGWISIFDRNSGDELQGFLPFNTSVITSSAISADGNLLLVGTGTDGAALIDLKSQRLRYHFQEQAPGVDSVAFSVDGKYAVTGGKDNTTVFYDLSSGSWAAKLVSTGAYEKGAWAVVTPDGRYDSSQPGNVRAFSYVMRDDPFQPLPVDIFMREYYEPRLLGRILAGENMPPVKVLSELNRVQPVVRIDSVEMESGNTVRVTVEVREGVGKNHQRSGARDLRLMRDGQLVAYAPRKSGAISLSDGTARFTFGHIKLSSMNEHEVKFSAYAFNNDGIKSATASKVFDPPINLFKRTPRAYLVSIGVNRYENAAWNLTYAANDAESFQRVIPDQLKRSGRFAEDDVVSIPLISREGSETAATKARIKAVFDLLAGKPIDPDVLASIPEADRIRPANPEDTLIITYSGHGYADINREFYLFPHDIGVGSKRSVAHDVLRHLVSSEELSLWLRDVDAGDIVMIIDACNSAASVEGSGFKPGPMGSRGLGQLAYDKGMRILAASQAESQALESSLILHGALTYSLVEEGIKQHLADYWPQDNRIMMNEWLNYAVKRVPKLIREIQSGSISTAHRGASSVIQESGNLSPYAQQPSLFDFHKRRRDILLAGTN
ncbi:MAG: hypothetical protein D6698_03450, partial [Gammaproteobacteria bacterium]